MKKLPKFKTKLTDVCSEYKYKKLLDESSKQNPSHIKRSKTDLLTISKQEINKIRINDYRPTFLKIPNDSFIKKDIICSVRFIDKELVNKINLDTKIKTIKKLLTSRNKKKSISKKMNKKSQDNIKIIKLKNDEKSQTIFRNIKYTNNKNSLRAVLSPSFLEKIKDFNNYFKDINTKNIAKKLFKSKIYKRKKCGFYRSISVKKEKESLIKVINVSFNSSLSVENKGLLINNGLNLLEKFFIKQKTKSLAESFYKLKIKIKAKKENKEQNNKIKKFYVKKEQYDLLKVLKKRKIRYLDDLKKYIITMYEQNYKYVM